MSQQRANIGAHTSIEKNNLAGIQLETVFEWNDFCRGCQRWIHVWFASNSKNPSSGPKIFICMCSHINIKIMFMVAKKNFWKNNRRINWDTPRKNYVVFKMNEKCTWLSLKSRNACVKVMAQVKIKAASSSMPMKHYDYLRKNQ